MRLSHALRSLLVASCLIPFPMRVGLRVVAPAAAGTSPRCPDRTNPHDRNHRTICARGGPDRWLAMQQPADSPGVRYFYPDGYFLPKPPISVGDYDIYIFS
jgi:hypothetical protein